MSDGRVRSRRSTETERVVVVGRGAVAAAMADWFARPEPVRDVPWMVERLDEVPLLDPQELLAGAAVIVLVLHDGDYATYAGTAPATRRTDVVAHAQRLLAAARAVGARHVLVVSSAMVHGAAAGQAPLTDDAPLLTADDGGLVGDLLAVEAVIARIRRRRTPLVTVLRPAALVGEGVDTMITRHFEAPRLLTVRGAVREWQFAHVADVASAAEHAVDHALAGPLTVGAPDVLSPTQVETASGLRRIELAAVTAFGTAERLHRVGVLPAPASELAYTVYPWTVASDRLRASGWEAAFTSAECLEVLLDAGTGRIALAGRRVGPKDAAALGAAGAAVAFLGTAAVWRQARVRRRG
ncbi:NAD-dependent epimerase/dehydratase family protein [Pengzhenrongella sicca]|uniref:Nucleoside-diphosphate sugar epimerase n=1 Tax=Pengzhenrongella sicca TaxID=2819238 RepID=A0A8A4ZGE9_9MICO|nr:NAD-dependent epimerase/dehydratase family protein [Pengzhenrongella sicca]QTE30023.1 nucleoside-diphosphate sugar epimerase [Pengzhenrongella sicca]